MERKTIVVIAATIALVALILGVILYAHWRTSTSGVIATPSLAVYWEPERLTIVDTINWGTIWPGDWSNRTVYIHNNGTVPLNVTVVTFNWSVNTTDIVLYSESFILSVDETKETHWNLHVNSTISGITHFSFDILVAGDKVTN